ncbi:hypothetical protein D7147_20200 [Micromonospora musae]|uniref:Uncharacterized protein n=1 Tax=Micromonospora musae TaxID=1894970 RepID=A0ABX9R230_9ACTN|nr:hypothetical protein D7147_20200 [Micromonospora musae]
MRGPVAGRFGRERSYTASFSGARARCAGPPAIGDRRVAEGDRDRRAEALLGPGVPGVRIDAGRGGCEAVRAGASGPDGGIT